MKKVYIAKSAGFCFGVNRAVEIVENLLRKKDIKVYTYGPIVHNNQMIKSLELKGVKIINSLERKFDEKSIVVIRAHGVSLEAIKELEERRIKYSDATCPFVSKIHKIVNENSKLKKIILIAGDKNHAEVKGIEGHCVNKSYIFNSKEEFLDIIKNISNKEVIVVQQTTFNIQKWNEIEKIINQNFSYIKTFNTICGATYKRQKESEEIARKSDLMLVIGGRNSSNTKKLKEVCEKYCDTILIETSREIPKKVIQNKDIIGITAGASTPLFVIKDIVNSVNF